MTGRNQALPAGTLDRDVLIGAVQFALDSIRAGVVGDALYLSAPGVTEDGLTWQQGDWIHVPGRELPEQAPRSADCGTGCCIAGWIVVTAQGEDLALDHAAIGVGLRQHAIKELFGRTMLGYVDGRALDEVVGELFFGENDLDDVLQAADNLLQVVGLERIHVDADGVLS